MGLRTFILRTVIQSQSLFPIQKIVKKVKSDPREKILEMLMLIQEISLLQNSPSLFLPHLFLVNLRLPQTWFGNMRLPDFFLLVTVVPPLMSKFLLPNRVKSSCFTISSLVDSCFLVILFYLLSWKSSQWRFINYHRIHFWNCRSSFGLWKPSYVTLVLMYSHAHLSWLSSQVSSNLMTANTTNRTILDAPSTCVGRIREKDLQESRLCRAARLTSPKIGSLTSSMWRWICRRFPAMKDQLSLSAHL
jgi:hypothetical protein